MEPKEDLDQNTAELELQITEEEEKTKASEKAISETPEMPCIPLRVDLPEDLEDWNSAEVQTVQKVDGCLLISFQYSGCNEGAPKLFKVKTGSGQQFDLRIAGAGPCEMLLESQALFDLKTLNLGPGKQVISIQGQKIEVSLSH
jgi:hypothetical protein